MNKKIKIALTFVFVAMCSLLPFLSMAQFDPGCNPAVDPACVPINGGLSFLIAAGVGYGIKKVRDQRRIKVDE